MMDEKVYLFDRKGKFLRQISRQGKGPGEYRSLNQVTFSTNKKTILLFTSPCLYKYNMEGDQWTFLNSGKDSLRVVLPCRYPKKQEAYRQFASTLSEDSNPVLVIVKLKK